jgi:hypothetical protein
MPQDEELDILVEDVRPIRRTSPSIRTKISHSRRSDTASIMPNRRRLPITAGQRPRTEFWNPTGRVRNLAR